MQSVPDRWLLGITAAVATLIAIAIFIGLTSPRGVAQTLSASSPEGIVQRHILALQDGDYKLAYGYLSNNLQASCLLESYHDAVDRFRETVEDRRIVLLDREILPNQKAVVHLRITELNVNPPFSVRDISQEERFVLIKEASTWRFDEPPWPIGWCPGLEIRKS